MRTKELHKFVHKLTGNDAKMFIERWHPRDGCVHDKVKTVAKNYSYKAGLVNFSINIYNNTVFC